MYELSEAQLPVTSAPDQVSAADEGKLASELAALGYPGLSHLKSRGRKKNPPEARHWRLLTDLSSEQLDHAA